jgi:DNA replication and repair protein RecF
VRLDRLVARGFRNLADLDCELPPEGAALLGRNGQGKTNFLEAVYYPVLFRSLRGAGDGELAHFGGPGFQVEATYTETDAEGARTGERTVAVAWRAGQRKKRITVDGDEVDRLLDVAGRWLAVAFLPSDVGLASGPATERRQYLDRMLSLADRRYLAALARYRAALAQRNSALRQGRPELARAFDAPLAQAGATLVAGRLAWAGGAAEQFAAEFEALGEAHAADLRYAGRPELADPAAWPAALDAALAKDRARAMTTVGPHRDDVLLLVGERAVRDFGSTGQQRSAAIALKLIEIATLERARATEPALLLDDVFAELDRERQRRLARRLLDRHGGRQVFLTAPRRDELPENLALPIWDVEGGSIRRD